jgi:hypothetical protein
VRDYFISLSLCIGSYIVVFRDVKLLSFAGEDGDRSDEEEPVVFKKKSIVRPDCEYASHLTFPGK